MTADSNGSISYASNIKPLFREEDQTAMDFVFDLWEYADVRENSQAILDHLEAGSMPCDGAWEPAKVELFRRWVNSGMPE